MAIGRDEDGYTKVDIDNIDLKLIAGFMWMRRHVSLRVQDCQVEYADTQVCHPPVLAPIRSTVECNTHKLHCDCPWMCMVPCV